jgi:hypothetical protein
MSRAPSANRLKFSADFAADLVIVNAFCGGGSAVAQRGAPLIWPLRE